MQRAPGPPRALAVLSGRSSHHSLRVLDGVGVRPHDPADRAQRVGVDQLRAWSPTRYGRLDVTGGGAHLADELSYDIFAQAAEALTASARPLGGLRARTLLAIGAS